MNKFVFVIIQWVFIAVQLIIGHYINKHEQELSKNKYTFLKIAYFFCMAMVFLMFFFVLFL